MMLFKNGVGRPSKEILRKRRILIFSIIILVSSVLAVFGTYVSRKSTSVLNAQTNDASTKNYKVGEYVFYDPVKNKVCSAQNYWTVHNQGTTCYRWVVISPNKKIELKESGKSKSYNTTRLLLDHDIGVGDLNETKAILNKLKLFWDNSNILKISNIGNNMILKLYKEDFYKINESWNISKMEIEPYVKSKKVSSVTFLYTNTRIYHSGKLHFNYNFNENYNTYKYNDNIGTKKHDGGYWVTNSDLDEEIFKEYKNKSYYVTPYGHIGLSDNNKKRGLRPTIYLKSSILSKKTNIKKINKINKVTDGLSSKIMLSDHNHEQMLKENKFYYPQGFTFYGKDKFYVYMMHRTEREDGVQYNDTNSSGMLLKYSKSFKLLGKYNSYHGNDLAYNSKTKNFYISTDEDGKARVSKILNGGNLETVMYDNDTKLPYYAAFTFDSDGKYMYGVDSYRRIIVRDANNYEIKYSFDSPIFEALQSVTYNNGYLYLVTYETLRVKGVCDTNYQLYCYNTPGTVTIYVYNVKYDSDGKPTKLFGQLVKKMYTNDLNKEKNASYEVESIGAINNEIYLGFAKKLNTNIVVPAVYKFTENYNTISYYKDNIKIAEQKVLKGSYVTLDAEGLKLDDSTEFKNMKNKKEYSKEAVVHVNENMKIKVVNKNK